MGIFKFLIMSSRLIAASVLSFVRNGGGNRVFAVFNFSPERQSVSFQSSFHLGSYVEFNSNEAITLAPDSTLELEPWSHRIFTADQ